MENPVLQWHCQLCWELGEEGAIPYVDVLQQNLCSFLNS